MPSPFPGMDPWLEARGVFPDLHNTLIANLREAINAVLPPPYFAAIGTRVRITEDGQSRFIEPDVDIFKPSGVNGSHGPAGGGGVATATLSEVQPITLRIPDEQAEEWMVEVRTGEGDEDLVTSIEILSRSNKQYASDGRHEYQRKQRELRERGVNLVEIDLLRSGKHTTIAPLDELRQKAGSYDYHISIYRPASLARDMSVYAIRLPQRLPRIEIPLRSGDPSVHVEMQPAFDRCYDSGLYSRRIRYSEPCDPPLSPEQQSWAEAILREKGMLAPSGV